MKKTRYHEGRKSSLVQALLLSTAVGIVADVHAANAAAAATEAAASGQLSEIVVTARRREEDLQSTPVSVSAMSGDLVNQLNIRSFQDLRGTIPNLEVLTLPNGGANLTIRGIGQGSVQVNVDAKTGFYVDEMYVARQEANSLYFYDVGSIQVLKGPQGTLFGKNTTAGAFLLTTARPTADPGGYLQVRAGALKRVDTEGAINVPLSDKVLTRISFRTQNADGYIKHLLDDEKSNNINDKSVRFQIRAYPTTKLTADLLTEYNETNTNGTTTVARGCRDNASYTVNYNALHAVSICRAYPILDQSDGPIVYGGATLNIPTSAALTEIARGGDYLSSNTPSLSGGGHRNPFNDTYATTVNFRLNYDITDDIALKSITGLRRSRSGWYNPTLNAPNDIYAEYNTTATTQFTQEVNLNGRGIQNRLNYVLGAFYYKQNTHFLQDTGPDWIDPTGYTYDANNKFSSYAFYAQASFKILEPLELTVGGRYSHDTKQAFSALNFQQIFTGRCAASPATATSPARTSFYNAFTVGQACNGIYFGRGKDSWHSFDPRVQLSYQVTPDIFAYASLTKGYNAGGFNQQLGANLGGALVSYNPEKLKAYEGGLKTEFWERRARFNLAYFYQDYTDIQTTLLITFNGVATRQVQTGATAHESGIEAEFEIRPIPALTVRANASYLRQHYDTIAPGVTAFNLTTPVNATPKFAYSVSASYTHEFGNGGTLKGSMDWRAVGARPACSPLTQAPPCAIPAYGLLGGRLELTPATDSPWSIALWGTNLLDARYQLTRSYNGGMGIDSITPGRPREYGVEVRRSF